MAARFRIATGNWSNAAQWDGGTTLPTAADDAYCNGFTVTLDQDVTVLSVRNDALASPVIAAGGSVTIATLPGGGRIVNANAICNSTTNLLNVTATANTLTVNGNGTRGVTGNGGFVLHLNNCFGSTVNWNGNLQSGSGGASSNAVGVTTSWGTFNHTGSATGTTVSTCISLNGSGARTASIGTVNGNGLNVSGGTGAGHTVTVSNVVNTVAGFTTAQNCLSLNQIIASATIVATASIAQGTSRLIDFNQATGSGVCSLNVASGAGDIVGPNTATTMIAVNAGVGANTTITCRDIFGISVGSPNSTGTIVQGSGVANTLTINARNCYAGTVSGVNVAAAVLNTAASAGVVLNLSGADGARGAAGAVGTHYAAANNSTGSFTINGIARGGTSTSGSGEAFRNLSSGAALVTKAMASGSLVNAVGANYGVVQSSNAGFITVDQIETGAGGWPAYLGRVFIRAAGVNEVRMREANNGTIMTLGEVAADYPAVADVRSGVAYNFGASTGTLAVPPVGSVALGVPTDATTGTAALSPTALLGAPLLTRLGNCATVQTTGDQIAAVSP